MSTGIGIIHNGHIVHEPIGENQNGSKAKAPANPSVRASPSDVAPLLRRFPPGSEKELAIRQGAPKPGKQVSAYSKATRALIRGIAPGRVEDLDEPEQMDLAHFGPRFGSGGVGFR